MAREIIVLSDFQAPNNDRVVTCAFWLIAPANQVTPRPNFLSAVPPLTAVPWGATPAEVTALQSGTTVELVVQSGQIPRGTSVATIQTGIQNAYAQAQAALTTQAPPSKFIGASWDGTIWTAAP